jgi:MarR family transcriptional regulator, lower aerobic nicotinate degradation pathway regulator
MTSAHPVSDLEAHLGYWLRMVSNAVSQSFARRVEAEGVTVAEWVFLRMLWDIDPVAPSLLAGRMGMTKGAISKLADRLNGKALVERRADPVDGRAQILSLTAAGRVLVPRLAALADVNDAAFFGTLSPEDRNDLERLLRKIVMDRKLTDVPTG